MRKIILYCLALISFSSVVAQSPEAIREIIRENSNFSIPTVTTYDNISIGKIASAPRGYKPFYYSLVGRHGSRYELIDTTFVRIADIFNRASEIGILTKEGENVRTVLNQATAQQMGKGGELTSLGQEQWRGIGRRAYQNFGDIFDSGSVEAKSSTKMRCVFSMVAFVEGMKEKNTKIFVEQEARQSFMQLLRPMLDNPASPQDLMLECRLKARGGKWRRDFADKLWYPGFSETVAKLVTDPDRLIKECEARSLFWFLYRTHHLLLFSQNFGFDNYDLIRRIYSLEDEYRFYCYHTSAWVYLSWGWGNENASIFASYLRPLVEDVLTKAQEAIDGKNPHVANLRFTHDSYFVPLTTILGFEGCAATYSPDIEKAVTSAPLCKVVPMGANVQMQLYRNKAGEVLVRLMLNENDVTLPIECKTAPFYPWDKFRALVEGNMAKMDKCRDAALARRRQN
jgi:hypothetical protein